MDVVELTADRTHDLRRRVLRDGTASEELAWAGDELAATVHLGIVDRGRVIAVSTWTPRTFPAAPGTPAVQLRGMAVDPDHRRRGVGRQLLAEGCRRAAQRGAEIVWARARSSSLEFYLAAGFERHGAEFVDATTGLPHVVISRRPTGDRSL